MGGGMRLSRQLLLLAGCLLAVASPAAAAVVASTAAVRPKAAYVPGEVLVRLEPTPTAAAATAAAPPPLPGVRLQRLVGLRQPAAAAAAAAAGAATGSTPTAGLPLGSTLLLTITDNTTVAAKVAQLIAHSAVAAAQPNYLLRVAIAEELTEASGWSVPDGVPPAEAAAAANAELLRANAAKAAAAAAAAAPAATNSSANVSAVTPNDALYGMLWHMQTVSVDAVWDSGRTGSKSVGICVIDTGIRTTHQDLAGNLASFMNRGEMSTGGLPAQGTAAYRDMSEPVVHGTHVAGIAAAVGMNGLGVVGMNWAVSLHMCKAADSYGSLPSASLLECYRLCGQIPGVRVVSASYNGYYDDTEPYPALERDAIAALGAKGILLVAATGNDGLDISARKSYPAWFPLPNIISVAASTRGDTRACFSNWGAASTHIAAPGEGIYSTWAFGDASYLSTSGTSMSTPMVSGAVALLAAAKPDATMEQLRSAILSSVDKSALWGSLVSSGGRLNVQRALQKLLGQAQAPQPPRTYFNFRLEARTQASIGFGRSIADVRTVSSMEACKTSCLQQGWCMYFQHRTSGTFSATWPGSAVTRSGNCLLVDGCAGILSRFAADGVTFGSNGGPHRHGPHPDGSYDL